MSGYDNFSHEASPLAAQNKRNVTRVRASVSRLDRRSQAGVPPSLARCSGQHMGPARCCPEVCDRKDAQDALLQSLRPCMKANGARNCVARSRLSLTCTRCKRISSVTIAACTDNCEPNPKMLLIWHPFGFQRLPGAFDLVVCMRA